MIVFLGSILEGDATLFAASLLANSGRYFSLFGVLVTAGVASSAFNEVLFHSARRAGKPYFERQASKHPRYRGVQDWVCRRSVPLLLASRYIFGFRLAIPVACGAVGMHPLVFLAANLAGAVLWVVPVGLAGYFLGHVLGTWWKEIRLYEWHIATALVVVVTALLAWLDPELRRVSTVFWRGREAALRSEARVRRLLTRMSRRRTECPPARHES